MTAATSMGLGARGQDRSRAHMRRERHGFYGSQFYDLQCAKIMNSLGNEIETGTPNVSHCFFTSTFSCKNAKLISEKCWPDRSAGLIKNYKNKPLALTNLVN